MVIHDDSGILKKHEDYVELSKILPAKTLSDSDAKKENVIELVRPRSASVVHFLVHGTPAGIRARDNWFTCWCFRAMKEKTI